MIDKIANWVLIAIVVALAVVFSLEEAKNDFLKKDNEVLKKVVAKQPFHYGELVFAPKKGKSNCWLIGINNEYKVPKGYEKKN